MSSESDIERGQVNSNGSLDVEREDNTIEQLKITLNTNLWKADSPLPFTCCIFRVPEVLRRQKKEAYEPDIVSIGPFHKGPDQKFKLVQNVKEWYLTCFLLRVKSITTLDTLIEKMKEMEEEARRCYADPPDHLDQNEFIEMLILDGCFLIELFRKASDKAKQDEHDPIFNVPCMLEYLYHDLLLLENQLPWFVLEFFYGIIERDNPDREPLSKVVIDFFRDSVADQSIFSYPKPKSDAKILHIVDVIRSALVQEHQDGSEDSNKASSRSKLTSHLPQRIPSATMLSEAGVKFRTYEDDEHEEEGGNKPCCILNITLEKGVFRIPPLAINERKVHCFGI